VTLRAAQSRWGAAKKSTSRAMETRDATKEAQNCVKCEIVSFTMKQILAFRIE
jgi:hypothetical protein